MRHVCPPLGKLVSKPRGQVLAEAIGVYEVLLSSREVETYDASFD